MARCDIAIMADILAEMAYVFDSSILELYGLDPVMPLLHAGQTTGRQMAMAIPSQGANSSSISAARTPISPQLVIPDIEQRTGVKFDYVPVLLGGVYKADRQHVARRIAAGHQEQARIRWSWRRNASCAATTSRPSASNPFFPVNTLMLMRGAVAAQFEGMFEPYFRAAYHHMWEEPKKMDDLEVFRAAFVASGIDVERVIARAQQDDVKKRLIAAHGRCGRARHLRLADLLRRQRNVLRQGPAARRRGIDPCATDRRRVRSKSA